PCHSPLMLGEARQIQKSVISYFESGTGQEKFPVKYLVLASQSPGVFNLGGDLGLLVNLIEQGDRDQLVDYATGCVDFFYLNSINLGLPLTTISFVEGAALSGGLESAISCNYLIAEKHCQMGLPEIRYNLFPGMGGYSFLARKLGLVRAEQIITTGKVHSGPKLYKMGLIDILAESGKGYEAVNCFIRKHRRAANGLRAIQVVKQQYNPLIYDELIDIANIWVDTALKLDRKDLKHMARFVYAQSRGGITAEHRPHGTHLVRTRQDRRIPHPETSFPLVDNNGNSILYERRKAFDRRAVEIMQVGN
ncbi:MAG: enoyl-CoA hydratase/isomerase family protein, partial [Desulfofustis sp.]|nr:enoyl-CoA hydratase/isomerase family protein [Desulfofustis sp.]